jgi:O-antigen ligase
VAAGSLVRVLLFGIPLYMFFYVAYGPASQIQRDVSRGTRRLYWFGVVSAAFACVDFYYQFPAPAGYGPQFIWLDSGVYRRAQGVFYEASTLGNVCAFSLIMIAVTMLRKRSERPVPGWALWLGAPILSAALILSYSRGSLLNLCVALSVLLYLERSRIRIGRLLAIAASCLAAGSLAALLLLPEVTSGYWLRLSYSRQFFFSQPESVLSGRLANWQEIATFLAAHPWHAILGIGYKTLPYSDFIGQTTIADNMYLSLLAETGIVGLAAFFLFNFAILRAAWQAARRDDSRTSFFGSWIFCFWIGELFQMLSGDLLTYWLALPLYFWARAMAVQRPRQN